MPRYIDAEDLVNRMEPQDMLDANDIAEFPTADVAPVVHAHWIDTGRSDGNDNYDFVCCRCKHTDIHSRQVKVPYCWFCGARMDEQENSKNKKE